MQKLIQIFFLLTISGSIVYANLDSVLNVYGVSETDFRYYKSINDQESFFTEYKDDDFLLILKIAQLNRINASRKKRKLFQVSLDIKVSRAANKSARMAAENDYTGHWDLNGMKPYHRYGIWLQDGRHVTENAYSFWTSQKIEPSWENLNELNKKAHQGFIKERAPNDLHKKNILDPVHNKVGIGFAVHQGRFCYYEEFVNDYFTFLKVDTISNQVRFSIPDSLKLVYVEMSYDAWPKPMTSKQINKKGSYLDQGKVIKSSLWMDDKEIVFKNGEFTLNLPTDKSGLYYLVIFVTDREEVIKSTKNALKIGGVILTKE